MGTDHSVHGRPPETGAHPAGGDRAVCPRFPNAPDRILLRETDDNAAGVPAPSKRRAGNRTFQPIASYIRSTSGENGTPRAGTETPIVYKYVRGPGSGSALFSAFFRHSSMMRPKAFSMAEKLASSAARRGLSTMSHCGPIFPRWSRNAARSRLLIRLRMTAPPMARGTVSPRRGPIICVAPENNSDPGRALQNAANRGPEIRKPWS